MSLNALTETDKAYLAGFFDGEGCVSISKYLQQGGRTPSYGLRALTSQKSKSVLVELRDLAGIGRVNKNGGNGSYIWQLAPLEACEFLSAILPYLRNKAPEARLAIEFQGKQGHKNSAGRGHPAPRAFVDEKEGYYRKLRGMKQRST